MSEEVLARLEMELPAVALAALDAASGKAAVSGAPLVMVIGDALYRVSASGDKELIRQLPPRVSVSGHAGGPDA
jgi:hypothetical protein